MKQSGRNIYHSILRVAALVVLAVLVFDSGLAFPVTKQLSDNTQQYVATVVGMSAAIEPTELNTLTAEISKRQQELDAREAALSEREISVNLNDQSFLSTKPDFSVYILSVILFIILVLIALNYALDLARYRNQVALLRKYENQA